MSAGVNDGVDPSAPAEGAEAAAEPERAPSGLVARPGSSPLIDEDQHPSVRRIRSKGAMKIPDDQVPAPPAPAPSDDAPMSLAPMRMISLGGDSQTKVRAAPVAATLIEPPTPPEPARPSSKIPPAPGTHLPSDPGWTPGPPATAIQDEKSLPRFAISDPEPSLPRFPTAEIEELADEDLSPDSDDDGPSLPPPRAIAHSRPDGAIPAAPPPRGPAVTRPDGVAASQPPRAMDPLPPMRPQMHSSPNDVITSARPPMQSRPPMDLPPPRVAMPSRPPTDGTVPSSPIAPPPPRAPMLSQPNLAEAVAAQEEARELSYDEIPPDPPTTEILDLAEMSEPPRTMEVEEIYVSLGDTATEEPAPHAKPEARTPPPPPKVSSPPPPTAEAKPGATPKPASAEAPASTRDEKPKSIKDKKRVRPWWEEMFDDDFLRSLERPRDRLVVAESLFIEERLGLQKGAVVLDLACGAGRHAVELTRRGYKVVGYDLSLAMLARAQDEASEANQNINFLHGDMREMAFESMFDGVYCWGMSFGFFEEEKNVNVVQRIHKALRPGGVFLLDVCNRDFIAPRQPNLVWFEGEGCICMDETNLDFITSRLKVKRTVMIEDGRTRELDYSIRLYGLHELGKILHDNGFKVLEVSGQIATPGVFFGSESPRCLVLAERG